MILSLLVILLLFVFVSSFLVGGGSQSIVLGNKVVSDGKEVFGELVLRVLWEMASFTLTEYHEFDASLFKEPLHEFEGKTAQSVAVGNHKC